MTDRFNNVITVCKFCGWYVPQVDEKTAEMLKIPVTGICRRTNNVMENKNYCKKGIRRKDAV